jgi:hypothetical protein
VSEHYNPKESFAADLLQMQQYRIVYAIFDCSGQQSETSPSRGPLAHDVAIRAHIYLASGVLLVRRVAET